MATLTSRFTSQMWIGRLEHLSRSRGAARSSPLVDFGELSRAGEGSERQLAGEGARYTITRRVLALLAVVLLAVSSVSRAAEIAFDLPDMIECRDVTPADFALARPALKVVEGKFRISARVVAGSLVDVVDFLYVLESDDRTLRLQDYLPNTTLESTVADDQIEISTCHEKSQSLSADAHVVYKPLALGGSYATGSKNSESSRYRQIAPKEQVLSSGTTNREHGVFFRLQPSRTASLEGAKEFTFLAAVPKTWRGDLCTISCTARAKKASLVSTSVVPAGAERATVGMYLAGDGEAAALAERLRTAQETYAALRVSRDTESVFDALSSHAVRFFSPKNSDLARKELETAHQGVVESQERLQRLAR